MFVLKSQTQLWRQLLCLTEVRVAQRLVQGQDEAVC